MSNNKPEFKFSGSTLYLKEVEAEKWAHATMRLTGQQLEGAR